MTLEFWILNIFSSEFLILQKKGKANFFGMSNLSDIGYLVHVNLCIYNCMYMIHRHES